jgi:DNA primase
MNKKLENLIDNLMRGKCGLLYQYLNEIEDLIYDNLTPQKIMLHYNIQEIHKNRCKCIIHNGDNNTSLQFTNKGFKCHSCNTTGTLLEFIRLASNFKTLNDAKIYAANNFTNINLPFYDVEDYKSKTKLAIINKFEITGSYITKDYYDISLLPNGYCNFKDNKIEKSTENIIIKSNANSKVSLDQELTKIEQEEIKKYGMPKYIKSLNNASSSKLISFCKNSSKFINKELLCNFMSYQYNLSEVDYVDNDLFLITKPDDLPSKSFSGILNRILFPIKDHFSNTVVGYLCRSIDKNHNTKWLLVTDFNDDGTIVEFNKGNFLYNLNKVKDKQPKELWITESIVDAIKLESLGYSAISSMGVNLSITQIGLINKFFGKDIALNIFFDNDSNNNSNTGKEMSYKLCHQLYDYGFKNLNIIEIDSLYGKDLTEWAINIRNNILLKNLVETWYKNRYTFNINDFSEINIIKDKTKATTNSLQCSSPLQLNNIYKLITMLENYLEKEDLKNLELSKLMNIDIEQFNLFSELLKNNIITRTKCFSELNIINLTEGQYNLLVNYYKTEEILSIDSHCNKRQISSIIFNTKKYKKSIDLSKYIPCLHKKIEDSLFEVAVDNDIYF